MAYDTGSSNNYGDIHLSGNARTHLGNTYNYGVNEDQQILQAILQSLHYPEMGRRGFDVSDAKADTFEWLFEDDGSQTSQSSKDSGWDETGSAKSEGKREEEKQLDEAERDLDTRNPADPFERNGRHSMATKLRCWLKDEGDRVFWITGKPGSG